MKGLGNLLYEGERLQRRTLLSDDCKYLGVAGLHQVVWVALSNFEVREESGGV